MKRKPKTLVCIEKSSDDNGFLRNTSKEYSRELRVSSVGDLVDKVIHRLWGRPIQTLYVIGHGTSGYQSVGNGQTIDKDNGKSLALRNDAFLLCGDAEDHLVRLRGLFCSTGTLVLGGCRVASGDKGKGLMLRLSRILDDVTVQASESTQYPPLGMEGTVVRCKGSTLCTVQSDGQCVQDDDEA